MKKILRLICSIFIFIVLTFIFIKTTNKIVMLPFFICGFAALGQSICSILGKTKYEKEFYKIYVVSFLMYWFGLLIYGSHISIKEGNYLFILFLIPFWAVGIYIARKSLFEKDDKKSSKKDDKIRQTYNWPIKNIITICMIVIFLLIGIIMTYFGITKTYKLSEMTKEYIITDGYFYQYDIYSGSTNEGKTYQLYYRYFVDGKEYSISTDYGTNYIPSENSVRKVKYNPTNPKEAILEGLSGENFLIYMGIFFILITVACILGMLKDAGYLYRFKIDILGLYIGVICLIIGIGTILFQNATTRSLIETVKSFGVIIIIPLAFILVGALQTINCLFRKN